MTRLPCSLSEYARFRANALSGEGRSPLLGISSSKTRLTSCRLGSGGFRTRLSCSSSEYARFRANALLGEGRSPLLGIPSSKTRLTSCQLDSGVLNASAVFIFKRVHRLGTVISFSVMYISKTAGLLQFCGGCLIAFRGNKTPITARQQPYHFADVAGDCPQVHTVL